MAIPNSAPNHELPSSTALHDSMRNSDQPKKKGWVWILILIVLAGGGYYFFKSRGSSESKAAPAPGARGTQGPVSVAVVAAQKQDVPYYLRDSDR